MQSYSIPDVPLIPQSKDMACWYASAQMLIEWRRSRSLSCEMAHPDPSEVPVLQQKFLANDGLPPSQVNDLAKELGLQEVPPQTPSPGYIASMLQTYGPLWFAGLVPSGHVMVITGIAANQIHINDPWPVNIGTRTTLTFDRFGQVLQPVETGPDGLLDSIAQRLGLRQAELCSNLLHFPGTGPGMSS